MTAGKDLTRDIVGKRVRLTGDGIIEADVTAIYFDQHHASLSFSGIYPDRGVAFSITIPDDADVEILD